MIIYRLQHKNSLCGPYHTYLSDINVDDKISREAFLKFTKILHEGDTTKNTEPYYDARQTSIAHPCFDYGLFDILMASPTTRFGCTSLDKLFEHWFGYEEGMLENAQAAGFQLLEIHIDERHALELNNQVLYDSLKVRHTKEISFPILHLEIQQEVLV